MENEEDSEMVDDPPQVLPCVPTTSTTTTNLSPRNYLPWEDLKPYFTYKKEIKKDTKNLSVLCLMCQKTLSAHKSSQSNLIKHFQASHKEEYAKYSKKKTDKSTDDGAPSNKKLKPAGPGQANIRHFLTDKDRRSEFVSQKRLDDVVINLIVKEGLPFDLVESPHFKTCTLIGLPENLNVISRKRLVSRLDDDYTRMKKSLNQTLSEIQYVTTTADCWSKFRRSYLGMTAHWIDPESLERQSAALALRRIYGRHTYVLAKEMNNVHKDYCIQNKVVKTTTDNASNFGKAFIVFGEVDIIQEDAGSGEAESTLEDEDEEIICIHDILNSSAEEGKITLPPHQTCSSHTLSLIAVTDAKNALSDSKYRKQSTSTFRKLKVLWRKQNQSTVLADAIKKILGVYLLTPNDTRWNALFDAVVFILVYLITASPNEDSPLAKVCDACGLERLSSEDTQFLVEYKLVNAPVAQALDILQGEKNMFLGYLLPTLVQVRTELTRLKDSDLVYCLPLVEAMLEGLNRRFAKDFADEDCIIAACSHPNFQFDWLDDKEQEETAKKLVLNALTEEAEKAQRGIIVAATSSETPPNDNTAGASFFKFKQKRGTPMNPPDLASDELRKYQTCKDTTVKCLDQFPLMKGVFIKFNTPLTSSGSVERFFSSTGNVFTIRRGKIDDSNLEMQVLLKVNKLN